MSQLLGTVIAAQITTGDTDNTFPIGDENLMLGGHHSELALIQRDAIPAERRVEGMTCWVASTAQLFRLVGGITNSDWVEETPSFIVNEIGYPALVTAWVGTATANVALGVASAGTDLGVLALKVATDGTNLAYTALQQAWFGTEAAAAIGYPALVTSWVGTATANVALQVGSTGTNAAAAAIDLGNKALLLAQTGTIPPFLDDLQDVNAPSPSVSQVLAWDGSKWIATDTPSQVAPGAFTLFLDDTSSGTAPYASLLTSPSGAPEVADVVAVGGATPLALIDGFLTLSSLNRTVINGGVWEFNNFVSIDNPTQPTSIVAEIYTKQINGGETFLFAGTSPQITSITPTPQLLSVIISQGTFNTATTDKLLAKYYFKNTGTSVNAVCYHSGTAHDSHFHSPIGFAHNDLAGLQGGQSFEYYHVTKNQNDALQGAYTTPTAANPFVNKQDLDTEKTQRQNADALEVVTRGTLTSALFTMAGTERIERQNADALEVIIRGTSDAAIILDYQGSIAALALASSGSASFILGDLTTEKTQRQNADALESVTRGTIDASIIGMVNTNSVISGTQFGIVTTYAGTERIERINADNLEIQTRGTNINFLQSEIDILNALTATLFAGTLAMYVSQVQNSDRADMSIRIANGVVTSFGTSSYGVETFDYYGTGPIGTTPGDLGLMSAWGGTGNVNGAQTTPSNSNLAFVGQDDFQSYAQFGTVYGPIASPGTLAGGLTFTSAWVAGTIGLFYAEDPQTMYGAGTVTVGAINAGTNWLSNGAIL